MKEVKREMYMFNDDKAKVLKGRTVRYLATEELFIGEGYLGEILNGITGCSKRLAYSICKCISEDANVEDYFIKKGE